MNSEWTEIITIIIMMVFVWWFLGEGGADLCEDVQAWGQWRRLHGCQAWINQRQRICQLSPDQNTERLICRTWEICCQLFGGITVQAESSPLRKSLLRLLPRRIFQQRQSQVYRGKRRGHRRTRTEGGALQCWVAKNNQKRRRAENIGWRFNTWSHIVTQKCNYAGL